MSRNQPFSAPTEAFTVFEASGWDHQAPTYGQFIGNLTDRLVDPLLAAAGVRTGSRVLDLATGPGFAAGRAAELGASPVGVDIAPAMVALARRLHPKVEFTLADGEELPFDDGTFDAACSNFVIPHLAHHDRVVGELVRVLATGGRLAMTTWDQPDRMRLLGVFLDAFAEAKAETPKEIPLGPPFFHYADDDKFIELFSDNGLVDVTVDTIGFVHHVKSPDQLWDGILGGTVRTSAFILGQTPSAQLRIRSAFDRLVQQYSRDDGLALPVSVKLASGRRAG